MKKYKNIFVSCLLVLLSFVLFACGSKHTVKFIDIDGTILKTEEVADGGAATAPEAPTKEGLEFVKWDTDFSAVTQDLEVKALYFGLNETPKLKMDFKFEGKEFKKDGVGEVELNRVVDGDTISVKSGGDFQAITIRFLGIDTPESTGTIEPWGKASSAYAKEVLYNAYSIVLEAEGTADERMDSSGNRWLAWVWYKATANSEYRLFNLEEVELGYAKYSQKVTSKYHDVFKKVNDQIKLTGKRVWGEVDSNFNYSKEHVNTTLLDLWYNHESFQSGTYFYVTVRLVRTVGNNMYLEDAEEVDLELEDGTIVSGKGHFYAFWGYSAPFYRYYNIGDVFKMRCQLEWDSDYGTQLTGLSKYSSAIKELSAKPEITVLDANELGYSLKEVKDDQGNMITDQVSDLSNYMCQVVTVENLICESVKLKGTGEDQYYTAVMRNKNGVKFDVYFSNNLISKWKATEVLEVGKTYSITGGVAYYSYANGYYQISVGDSPRYNDGVLNPADILRVEDVKEMK